MPGYFLSKIMYGQDRVKTPLLRKKNGKYDKDGEFTPVSWKEAFDVMAEKFKAATGIDLEIAVHATNEEIMGKVTASGGEGYDVLFVSSPFAEALKAAGITRISAPALTSRRYSSGNRMS